VFCGGFFFFSLQTRSSTFLTRPPSIPKNKKPALQSAKRKALDVLHGLGLSDSLLRVIERRQKVDAWLAYGGMAVVSAILFAAWWWWKR
jgi:hypothetical protein